MSEFAVVSDNPFITTSRIHGLKKKDYSLNLGSSKSYLKPKEQTNEFSQKVHQGFRVFVDQSPPKMKPGFCEVKNTRMSNAPAYTVGRLLPDHGDLNVSKCLIKPSVCREGKWGGGAKIGIAEIDRWTDLFTGTPSSVR